MSNRKEYPVAFYPKGLSDGWEATGLFNGACHTLQNLIFDQANPTTMIARPGVGSPITSFAGFTSPTAVSVQVNVDGWIYGMVSTGRTPGFDEPFAYNIDTATFTTVTGVTSANVPGTLSTVGDWIPPVMAIIGTKIIVAHTGFSGAGSNFFGVIDISTPSAPAWSAQNTSTTPLPFVPTTVANFNNRAYFGSGNTVYFSDVLNPLKVSSGGQTLTIGDTTTINALVGLPIQTSTAGAISGLLAFKNKQIWQITGDASITNSLSLNFLTLEFGSRSPRSIIQAPIGVIFVSGDGVYYVNPLGGVLPLTNGPNNPLQDINYAFHNVVYASRTTAAFCQSVYRVCLETILEGVQGTYDFWFDFNFQRWNGPHTFAYDSISTYQDNFLLANRNVGAKIFKASFLHDTASVFNDNGTPITVILQSSLLPRTPNINVKQVIESTIELASIGVNGSYLVEAFNETLTVIASTTFLVNTTGTTWGGGSTWGDGSIYTASYAAPKTNTIPWPNPLIFKKMGIRITAQATTYTTIGGFFCKYRDCGYLNIG